jgi:hypothetical protein
MPSLIHHISQLYTPEKKSTFTVLTKLSTDSESCNMQRTIPFTNRLYKDKVHKNITDGCRALGGSVSEKEVLTDEQCLGYNF